MSTITDHIRRSLLEQAGIFDPTQRVDLAAQWDDQFETLMRNRMRMGAYRYGHFRSSQAVPAVLVSSMRRRLDRYMATGNTECLVDVANLCLIEFCTSTHPRRHFRAIDGDEAEVTRVRY